MTPASPKDSGLPEWAQAPDLEAFGRKISGLPTLELRNFAVELVSGQRTRLLEDLRERPLSREEAAERAVNFARELIVRDELSLRGEELPEEFVLGFRRAFNALTPPGGGKDAFARSGAGAGSQLIPGDGAPIASAKVSRPAWTR